MRKEVVGTTKKGEYMTKKSEQFVMVGLQQGIFPWGYAVKMSSKWTYFINAVKFYESEKL